MIDLVAGARPNFVKLAPVLRAVRAGGRLQPRVVYTGQHYDMAMSEAFARDLGLPAPDVHLDAGSGPHGAQTARILERYEAKLLEGRPSAVVVFGDVNSTLACALAAVKLQIPVAHVEAGLRSFDRSMPEEINRVLTDAVAGLHLVSEQSGVENLAHEGIDPVGVRLVGNVMIDTLVAELERARASAVLATLGIDRRAYGLITLHRPSNVDDPATLERLMALFEELAQDVPLVYPMHPRTRAAIERAGIRCRSDRTAPLRVLAPLSYRDNLALIAGARVVLTDSGGVQEETSVLNVPCLTLRSRTERPITVAFGTSRLVGSDGDRIRSAFADAVAGRWRDARPIPLWDGAAGERVASALAEWCG